MSKATLFFFTWLLLCSLKGLSQESISFQEVAELALENNLSIRLAKQGAEVVKADNTLGNAGFMPSAEAVFDLTRAQRDSRLQFFNGEQIEADGAQSDALRGAVLFDWVLFDGLRMFATKDKLNELEALGELELQFQVEAILQAAALTYYQLSQEEAVLRVFRDRLGSSRQRYEIEQRTFELGGADELALLNAEVDMNADSAMVMQQMIRVENLQTDLNLLMNRPTDATFKTKGQIAIGSPLDPERLLPQMTAANTSLLAARTRSEVASIEMREFKAGRLPSLVLSADYSLNQQVNEVGVLQSNLTRGPNVGIAVRWNLFDGLRNQREIAKRKIIFEQAQVQEELVLKESESEWTKLYRTYRMNRAIYELEESNVRSARKNLEVANRSYELGGINALDLRLIEQKVLEAELRVLQSAYEVKVSEVQLLRLSGQITQLLEAD